MYLLPNSFDWSFLVGQELEQLGIGKYSVVLTFDGKSSISINVEEGGRPFEFVDRQQLPRKDGYTLYHAAELIAIVGKRLTNAFSEDACTLVLVFEAGQSLRIFEQGDGYESFVVWLPDGSFLAV